MSIGTVSKRRLPEAAKFIQELQSCGEIRKCALSDGSVCAHRNTWDIATS